MRTLPFPIFFSQVQAQVWSEAVPWSHLLELLRNLPYITFRGPQLNTLVFVLRLVRAVRRSEVLSSRIADLEEAVSRVSCHRDHDSEALVEGDDDADHDGDAGRCA